jgi:hypothetical protein
VETTDVGQYSLNLRDDTRTYSNVDIGGAITNSSLTVRPFALYVNTAKQGATANPTGTSNFIAAGDTFEATVSAVRWSSALDTNSDGNPDVTPVANASAWATAATFRTASFAAATTLAVGSVTEPSGGGSGTLSGTGTTILAGVWASGQAVLAANSLSFNNVGSFTASATAGGYLGLGGNLPWVSDVIGRFYPYRFGLKTGTGSVTPAWVAGNFTYMGPPFGLSYTLPALDQNGSLTSNYGSSYGGTILTPSLVLEDTAYAGTDLGPRITGAPTASWSGGEYIATGSAVVFSRPSIPATNSGAVTDWGGPFGTLASATMSVGVKASGTESNQPVGSANMRADTSGICTTATNAATDCNAIQLPTGSPTRMFFGMLRLDNAYGSELLGRLVIPVRRLYLSGFSGSAPLFNTNTLDSCTAVPVPLVAGTAVNLSASNYTTAYNSTTRNVDVTWAAAGRVAGSLDYSVNLSTATWLQGNWTGGNYSQNPTARIKLGSPKAPYIYLRERY